MLIAGMPFVSVVSVIVGVTNLFPTFGPIVGAVLGSLVLVLVSPRAVIFFLIFTIILQTIDGYVIKPKLFGGALNVSSVLILAAIIVGGKVCGMIGVLLSIPVAAILVYVYNELIIPRLEKRKEEKA